MEINHDSRLCLVLNSDDIFEFVAFKIFADNILQFVLLSFDNL